MAESNALEDVGGVLYNAQSGNAAKLSSAGLWLNASKPESVLETMMLVPRMLVAYR
jgi:hypothetical protein